MDLAGLCQIRSSFHPKAGKYSVGDKCHQLKYLIRSVNDTTRKTFDLGPTAAFYDISLSTCSRFCCARQYNKDKLDKFHIDLFVLVDSTH